MEAQHKSLATVRNGNNLERFPGEKPGSISRRHQQRGKWVPAFPTEPVRWAEGPRDSVRFRPGRVGRPAGGQLAMTAEWEPPLRGAQRRSNLEDQAQLTP